MAAVHAPIQDVDASLKPVAVNDSRQPYWARLSRKLLASLDRFKADFRFLLEQIDLVLRRTGGPSANDEESGILLQTSPYKGRERDALIDALAGTSTDQGRKDIEAYAGQHLAFIISQFRLLDDPLLHVLGPESSAYSSNNQPPFALICKFLTAIIVTIKTEHAPALNTVKRYLEGQNLIKRSVPSNAVHQLVFAGFGLVTAFFRPSLAPKAGCLQLAEPEPSTTALRRARTWHSNSKDIDDDIVNLSLCDLLFRFSESNEGPIPRPLLGDTKAPPLVSSNLSYYTLAELAGLQIEWIDSICEHLELDTRRKTLKLFRFPSICMTMCAKSEDHTTWLEKLFRNAMEPAGAQTNGDFEEEKRLRSAHFFREVVYSYALFFAQSSHSRSKFQSHQRSGRSQLPAHNRDPLLEKLYSAEWSTALIDDLGIGDVKLSYKSETDFPFFAHRLQILQEFSQAQTPNSWKLLWKDRRDLNRFYTLWAALIFGILTLGMGLIQILLAVAQVVAGFRNNV